ncbi:unnamed protein product [Linum tenue]|uniref:Peptidase C14 caspase domain-containing protein n=1 Tax=Linum tenue TaxID=586396 RepID=A0AAV0IZ43_9ROSI|nr:unnamed protein product [Linum tenue]
MGSRRKERCGWCGLKLMVPSDSQSFQCAVCKGITRAPTRPPHDLQLAAPTYRPPYYGGGGYASSLPPLPPPPPSLRYGRKKALLCGVSYRGKRYQIKGSINDVKCMRYFLLHKSGFPPDSILMLTEDETNPRRIPTKENIRMGLRWLVQGCQAGDSLVFHFSGHGSRQRDYDLDEVDGFDETLCPLDFETEGMIIDDEVNATIVRPLPRAATLHAIIDSCYSATLLDLPFACRMNSRDGQYTWADHRRPSPYYATKDTNGGLAICFSACNDDETSADTTAMTGNISTGALTYSFIQAVHNEPGLSYGRLLTAMRQAIQLARSGGLRLTGPIASLLNNTLFSTQLKQEPQLTCSQTFEVYSRQFTL